jgi:DNA-binding NarL/FixJ family response regulator
LRENRSPSRGRLTWLVLDNISRLAQQRDTHTDIRLTPREKEILDLVTRGLSNKEIADCLSIALNTVKNHVHNMLDKLNVRSRHEAAWVETHSSRQSARSRRSKKPLIDRLNEHSLSA